MYFCSSLKTYPNTHIPKHTYTQTLKHKHTQSCPNTQTCPNTHIPKHSHISKHTDKQQIKNSILLFVIEQRILHYQMMKWKGHEVLLSGLCIKSTKKNLINFSIINIEALKIFTQSSVYEKVQRYRNQFWCMLSHLINSEYSTGLLNCWITQNAYILCVSRLTS